MDRLPPAIERVTQETSRLAVDLLLAQFAEHGISSSQQAARGAIDGLLSDEARGFAFLAGTSAPVGLAVCAFTWTVEHGGLVAWLDELYVVPHLRDRGIGRSLLLRVIAECERVGCIALELEVDSGHRRAAGLYAREGFTPLPRARFSRKLDPMRR